MPKAQKPSATAAARLTEMRQLMRRFVAKELYNKEWIECRLIAQPIDRYQSEAEKIVDGAIFALANGTNPEFGIVLETDGTRWQYGVLRLSSAESIITLDGEKIAAFEYFPPAAPATGRTTAAHIGSSPASRGERATISIADQGSPENTDVLPHAPVGDRRG